MQLDHVSIYAPPGGLEALGFTVTATPGADGQHARVLLDGGYVEVAPARALAGRGWFLRPDDVAVAARMLRQRGVDAAEPVTYKGHDGTWLDIELAVTGLEAALPTITRRTPSRSPHRQAGVHRRNGGNNDAFAERAAFVPIGIAKCDGSSAGPDRDGDALANAPQLLGCDLRGGGVDAAQ